MKKKKLVNMNMILQKFFFENKNNKDFTDSKKKLRNFISLLGQGISFSSLAKKYGYESSGNQNSESNWIIEDNLEKEINKILSEMKVDQVSEGIKVENGYKIIKLNRKRIFGYQNIKYSFIKISAFDIENLDFSKFSSISCLNDEFTINNDISAIKIKNIVANEMISIFLENLENLEVGKFSNVIDHNNEFSVLKLCDKRDETNEVQKKKMIENKLYSQKV